MPCGACVPYVINPKGIPTGHTAVQPVGSLPAQGPGVWMSSVTDTCPPLSLLAFLPQYFHGTPVQSAGFLRLCHRGRWTQMVLFQAIPAWMPLHLPWEEPLEPKAMAKGALSPMSKLTGRICCQLGHLQCQQGQGALSTLTLYCCLFLVFHDRLFGEKE